MERAAGGGREGGGWRLGAMGAHGGGINRRVRSSAAIDDALPRAWSAGDSCDLDGLGDGSSGSGLALHARSGSSDGHDSLGSLASGRGSGDGEAFDARRHPGETLLQFCVDAASGASAADGAPDETCKRGEVALRVADDDVRASLPSIPGSARPLALPARRAHAPPACSGGPTAGIARADARPPPSPHTNTPTLQRQSARHLQPDMPLVYVSITSSVLLLYFVAFVDTPSMMRLFTPLDVDETPGLEQLHTGFSAGASILLGFFVWLLHALLYDIVGMVVGLPPAAITFGCSFAYRVVARNNGYLIFAMLAVVLGLEAGRRGMAWDARRRRRRLAGYRPSGKALVGSMSAIGMGGSHTHSSSLRRSTSSTAGDLTGEVRRLAV